MLDLKTKIDTKNYALKIISLVENLLDLPVYLVGGAVRDLLLGNSIKDWDFATPCSPEQVEMAVRRAGRKPYLLGKKFGTIGFKLEIDQIIQEDNSKNNQKHKFEENKTKNNFEKGNLEDNLENKSENKFEFVEITTFRTEIYQEKSRKPEVVFTDQIDVDLARRDFTINAMGMNSKGEIIDNWNGQNDLENKIIRAVGKPKVRFREDPLRILRAIRLAASLGFEIESKTWDKLCKMRFEILNISKERWILEIDKILGLESPAKLEKGLDLLMESGILAVIIPELTLQKNYHQNSIYHDFNLWTHTKKVVCNIPFDNLDLRWTALLHDIAKPFVRTENKNGNSNYINHDILGAQMSLKVSNYLKFSNCRKEFIFENILNHLKPKSPLKTYDDLGKKIEKTDE